MRKDLLYMYTLFVFGDALSPGAGLANGRYVEEQFKIRCHFYHRQRLLCANPTRCVMAICCRRWRVQITTNASGGSIVVVPSTQVRRSMLGS